MEFIPIEEETGQIYEIETWIIRNVLLQKENGKTKALKTLVCQLIYRVKHFPIINSFGVRPDVIQSFKSIIKIVIMEITETALLSDDTTTVESLLLI
ncbi:hypothetical protein KHA80_05335 [Anaerobacillus sp. HL2]|nr:hypothetical protein KHA80_05335 [Anaerobacillus sp. HL2]